jgi:hypothetical protein
LVTGDLGAIKGQICCPDRMSVSVTSKVCELSLRRVHVSTDFARPVLIMLDTVSLTLSSC